MRGRAPGVRCGKAAAALLVTLPLCSCVAESSPSRAPTSASSSTPTAATVAADVLDSFHLDLEPSLRIVRVAYPAGGDADRIVLQVAGTSDGVRRQVAALGIGRDELRPGAAVFQLDTLDAVGWPLRIDRNDPAACSANKSVRGVAFQVLIPRCTGGEMVVFAQRGV